jgi:putative transposase
MPWREVRAVDERLRLVAACLQGHDAIAQVCRDFGVSRKTAYKWLQRYSEDGPSGLESRSTRPHGNRRSPPDEIVRAIVDGRRSHPTWGPRKLRTWMLAKDPSLQLPSASTMGNLLSTYGLTQQAKRRRRTPPFEYPFSECAAPNDVWCIDFKGHFKMGNKARCHPLTLTDAHSRYLLLCKGMAGPTLDATKRALERAFLDHGLPLRIRSDNGTPFASSGAGGLSRLSVWWLNLGILPERIEPGKPQQNGRHERFHRTLKDATARPAAENMRAQQRAFDRFKVEYNEERPHEALQGATPATRHTRSPRPFPSRPPGVQHPDGADVRKVISNGRLRWRGNLIFVNSALTGEYVSVIEREANTTSSASVPYTWASSIRNDPPWGLFMKARRPTQSSAVTDVFGRTCYLCLGCTTAVDTQYVVNTDRRACDERRGGQGDEVWGQRTRSVLRHVGKLARVLGAADGPSPLRPAVCSRRSSYVVALPRVPTAALISRRSTLPSSTRRSQVYCG